MCHIKDCAARAEKDGAEDTSGQTRQLHKAGPAPAHSPTQLSDTTDSVSLSYWSSRRTYCNCQGGGLTVASARDPGAVCHVGLLPLHAIAAKGWHSPTGSRMQQVLSSLDVLVHGH